MLKLWQDYLQSIDGGPAEPHPYLVGVMGELEKRGIVDGDWVYTVDLDQIDMNFVRAVVEGSSS